MQARNNYCAYLSYAGNVLNMIWKRKYFIKVFPNEVILHNNLHVFMQRQVEISLSLVSRDSEISITWSEDFNSRILATWFEIALRVTRIEICLSRLGKFLVICSFSLWQNHGNIYCSDLFYWLALLSFTCSWRDNYCKCCHLLSPLWLFLIKQRNIS